MKKMYLVVALLVLLLSCAACDEVAETAETPPSTSSQSASDSLSLPESTASSATTTVPSTSSVSPSPSSAPAAPVSYVEVSAVELDSKPTVTLAKGETSQIRAAAMPNNISPSDKELSYSIDNPAVATVSDKGLITYVGEGTAKVTATSTNGKKVVVTVTCKSATPASSSTSPSSGSTGKMSNSIDDMLEVDDSHDQRKWEAGVSVPMTAYYDGSQTYEQVFSDVSDMIKAYGMMVRSTGFINNGTSEYGGNIRIWPDENNGRYAIVIYNWRKSSTDSGINASINSALVTMKYFLGDENGKTLWKFIDATQTDAMTATEAFDTFSITDVSSESNPRIGDFVFEDGNIVSYDQTDLPRQLIIYLT